MQPDEARANERGKAVKGAARGARLALDGRGVADPALDPTFLASSRHSQ